MSEHFFLFVVSPPSRPTTPTFAPDRIHPIPHAPVLAASKDAQKRGRRRLAARTRCAPLRRKGRFARAAEDAVAARHVDEGHVAVVQVAEAEDARRHVRDERRGVVHLGGAFAHCLGVALALALGGRRLLVVRTVHKDAVTPNRPVREVLGSRAVRATDLRMPNVPRPCAVHDEDFCVRCGCCMRPDVRTHTHRHISRDCGQNRLFQKNDLNVKTKKGIPLEGGTDVIQ